MRLILTAINENNTHLNYFCQKIYIKKGWQNHPFFEFHVSDKKLHTTRF